MSDLELIYDFDGQKMPASKAIELVIQKASKMPPETAKAYIAYYSQLFNHTIAITELKARNNMKTKRIVALCGLIGLIVMIYLAYKTPYVSKWQSNSFWVGICVFSAACAAVIPGFLEIQWGKWLGAGGAIATFVLMYFKPPVVNAEDFSNPVYKINFYVANVDTTSISKFPMEFNPNSNENICTYCNKSISEYYGETLKDSLIFFRKSDGKIFSSEICSQIVPNDREVIGISNKLASMFKNKREAYEHFMLIVAKE